MIVAGSNRQCVNTSASASAWGSCAGTAGVQTLDADGSQLTVNAAVSTSQNLKSFTISAGILNAVGKSFRFYSGGNFVPVNTTERITFSANVGSSPSPILGFTPTSTLTGFWIREMTSTVVTSGSSGSWGSTGRTEVMGGAGVSHVSNMRCTARR